MKTELLGKKVTALQIVPVKTSEGRTQNYQLNFYTGDDGQRQLIESYSFHSEEGMKTVCSQYGAGTFDQDGYWYMDEKERKVKSKKAKVS